MAQTSTTSPTGSTPVASSPLPRNWPKSNDSPVLSGFAYNSTWSKSAGTPPSRVPSHWTNTHSVRHTAVTPVGLPGGVVSPTHGMMPLLPGIAAPVSPPPIHVSVPSPLSTAMVPDRYVNRILLLRRAISAKVNGREASSGLISTWSAKTHTPKTENPTKTWGGYKKTPRKRGV